MFILCASTVINSRSCSTCMASLQPEDSHDLYPSCLDLVHLREGLSEDPCMNCSFMPRVAARLAEVKLLKGDADAPLWKKTKSDKLSS